MMDTNIFGKLEPFEIGCVVKSELDKLIQAKDECLNPLKSGRVVKSKKGICGYSKKGIVLIPLNRVVLLNQKFLNAKGLLSLGLNPLKSGRVVK